MTRYRDDASPWAAVEVSLPKVLTGRNDVLLSWGDVQTAAHLLVDSAADAARAVFPPVEEWRVNRIDAVWAWADEPTPYLAALGLGHLNRCTTTRYPSGVRWQLPRGGVVARGYDKAAEVGHPVDLPLRLEREARPKKHTVRVDGQRVGGPWATFTDSTARGLVRELVHELALDRPVRTPAVARALLVQAHGPRAGENVYRALLAAREAGSWDGVGGSAATRRRARRMAREAGVSTLYDHELAPLDVPS